MAIASVADLITELRDSQLLETPQLAELTQQLEGRFPDPQALARHLIEKGWLTPFHVHQLLQGRGKELVLGPYVLLDHVGEGGMGQVFKARQKTLDRIVALKVIRKEWLTQPEAVRRFQREIRAASQLKHPNIVLSFDAGQLGDTHYIAMEFVEGIDLGRLVKQKGALPVDVACDFIRQAALGLQHACELGMVHRDIKPSNLLLTRRGPHKQGPWGTIKILDMGLARVPRPTENIDSSDSGSGTLTHVGSVVGTPDYIAPEQARDAHKVDIRADLYSLGCTFYFLLTGQVPFPGGTGMEKLFKHQLDPPRPVQELRPELSLEAAAVVHRLLAKRPDERYQTPAEVALAVQPFVATAQAVQIAVPAEVASPQHPTQLATEEVTPSEATERPVPAHPAPRGRPWLVPFAALGLLGALLIGFSFLGRGTGTGGQAPGAADFIVPGKPVLDQLDAARIPAGERIANLPPEVVAVLGEHRLHSWGQAQAVAFSPDGKSLAVVNPRVLRTFDMSTGQPTGAVPVAPAWAAGAAYLPDGRTVAIMSAGEPLRSWDVVTGKPAAARIGPADAQWLALAPDGRRAVVTDKPGSANAKVRLWDLVSDREIAVLGSASAGAAAAFSADGRAAVGWVRNAAATATNELTVIDMNGKERYRLPLEKGDSARFASVSGDGETLAVSLTHRLEVWNLARRQKLFSQELSSSGVRYVLLSPDGQMLVVAAQQKTGSSGLFGFQDQVRVLNAATGQERFPVPVSGGMAWTAAFTPDGRTLVLGGTAARLSLWDMAAGREKFPEPAGHRVAALGLAFSADGRTLASAGGFGDPQVKLWDVALAKERTVLPELGVFSFNGTFGAGTFAGDRQTIVTRSPQGFAAWSLTTGRELGRVSMSNAGSVQSVTSANGKVLAIYGGTETTIRLLELPSFHTLATIPGVPALAFGPALSGDGQALATVDARGKVRLWETASGRELPSALPLVGSGLITLALNRDGKLLAACSEGTVRMWDVHNGQQRLAHSFTGGVARQFFLGMAEFSACGDLAASNMHEVKVWDSATGKERPTPRPSTDHLALAVLSPDGKLLVTIDQTGTLLAWDTTAGREVRRLTLPGAVSRIAFAPDGRHLATANANGTIYILRLVPGPI